MDSTPAEDADRLHLGLAPATPAGRAEMGNPMVLRARRQGSDVVLRVLMAHLMETGRSKDAEGQLIPAWFIQQVEVWAGEERVLSADWGPAVSRNPFLQIELRDAQPGEQIRVRWRDNRGDVREDAISLP